MYKVVDYYEGYEVLAICNTWLEANKVYRQQVKDTDGECDVEIVDMDVEGIANN